MTDDGLPIIDVAALWGDDGAARARVAGAVGHACEARGFFYVVGAPRVSALGPEVLEQARRLFARPLSEKRAMARGQGVSRGYLRFGDPADADAKEEFYLGREGAAEANLWPPGDESFRAVMLPYVEAMHDLAERLLAGLAVSLGLPEDHFAAFCRDPLASLRLVRYPPEAPSGAAHTAAPHTDFGGLTLLLQDGHGGLEVHDGRVGTWIPAPPVAGSLVVNIGDLMARWSNDRYRSTLHRVVNRSGAERYSAPFFFSGAPSYPITCLPGCLRDGEAPRYPPTTVEAHLRERFDQVYGSARP